MISYLDVMFMIPAKIYVHVGMGWCYFLLYTSRIEDPEACSKRPAGPELVLSSVTHEPSMTPWQWILTLVTAPHVNSSMCGKTTYFMPLKRTGPTAKPE